MTETENSGRRGAFRRGRTPPEAYRSRYPALRAQGKTERPQRRTIFSAAALRMGVLLPAGYGSTGSQRQALVFSKKPVMDVSGRSFSVRRC